MLHAVRRVDGRVLWANLHLLFWLSLVPFVTAWMGTHRFSSSPTFLYGLVLLAAGGAYKVLQAEVLRGHAPDSPLVAALGDDRKGLFSLFAYALALPLAFLSPWVSGAIYLAVAVMWIVPDRRIEGALAAD